MSAPSPELEATENAVFTTVRQRIAMPLLEVAAATEIDIEKLRITVDKLADMDLVTIDDREEDPIVSVNKKFL